MKVPDPETGAFRIQTIQLRKPDRSDRDVCSRSVLLEWCMRDGAGLGVAERLRRASLKQLVIVVVSTQDDPEGSWRVRTSTATS